MSNLRTREQAYRLTVFLVCMYKSHCMKREKRDDETISQNDTVPPKVTVGSGATP